MFLIPLARRVASAFFVLCLGYATHASAQQITLKLHHFVPPTATAHARFLVPWVERIEKESNGRIKIQIYPASNRWVTKLLAVLGATPVGMPVGQVPDALSKHVIDGAAMPWEIIPSLKVHDLVKFHSELPVLALPKVHTNHEPCSRCRVDQAQRIQHSTISSRRTLFATVDPLLVAAVAFVPRLIHPTV